MSVFVKSRKSLISRKQKYFFSGSSEVFSINGIRIEDTMLFLINWVIYSQGMYFRKWKQEENVANIILAVISYLIWYIYIFRSQIFLIPNVNIKCQ